MQIKTIGELRQLLAEAWDLDREIHEQHDNPYYNRREAKARIDQIDKTEIGFSHPQKTGDQ